MISLILRIYRNNNGDCTPWSVSHARYYPRAFPAGGAVLIDFFTQIDETLVKREREKNAR